MDVSKSKDTVKTTTHIEMLREHDVEKITF